RQRYPRALPLLLSALFLLPACGGDAPGAGSATAPDTRPAPMVERDEHSRAEPDKVAIEHLALDLALDFEARTLSGTATYRLQSKDPGSTSLVLDPRDLVIERVESEASGTWQPVPFALGEADPALGSALTIQAPQQPAQVRVTYRTSPGA